MTRTAKYKMPAPNERQRGRQRRENWILDNKAGGLKTQINSLNI